MDFDTSMEAIRQWHRIREENGFPVNDRWQDAADTGQLSADMAHSALLRRLFDGQEPFEEPPPRAYSYPNYNAIEKGSYEPGEVFRAKHPDTGVDALVIDQMFWTILTTKGEEEWIVGYEVTDKDALQRLAHDANMSVRTYLIQTPRPAIPKRLAASKWHVRRNGVRPGMVEGESHAKLWISDRL